MKIDFKIAVSFLAAYVVFLLYIYQFAFFAVVGFQFLGAMGVFDIWSNIGFVLPYVFGFAALMLVILIAFQICEQSGFNIQEWIVEHTTLLAMIFGAVSLMLLFWAYIQASPHLIILLMGFSILLEMAVVYCNLVSRRKIILWSSVSIAVCAAVISAMLGAYSAIYSLHWDARRYDLILDGSKMSSVRILRTSMSGVIYEQEHQIGFVNMSKVKVISPDISP